LAASCRGFSAVTSWIVEQLGLAMMFFFLASLTASGFTSGTISGTSGSMRKADELSITMGPALPIFSDHSLETSPPARHQDDVDRGEVELFDVLAFDGLVAERDLDALGLARGDGVHLVDGEFELLEDVQHFAAHIARGPDDRDAITHVSCPSDALSLGPRGLAA
jgi:hypothetical protein